MSYPVAPKVRLEPGEAYRVAVRPYRRNNPAFYSISDVPFVVLGEAQRRALADSLERLRQSLDARAEDLAVAARLAGDEVYGEALNKLDRAAVNDTGNAAMTLLGARFAEELGLYTEASRRYGAARQAAEAESNDLVRADALEGLARSAKDHGEARRLYEEALGVWTALGDGGGMARVREALGRLE